jgi:hypothetical protein
MTRIEIAAQGTTLRNKVATIRGRTPVHKGKRTRESDISSTHVNHFTPRATEVSDRNKTNGVTTALTSNGGIIPVRSAINQYSGTAMIVSRIAVTDGSSF